MKLGILGTGMIVKDLLTTIHKLKFDSISILGTLKSKEHTIELCKKYNLDKYYFDYDEMLQSDVDTIYVALPNFLHYEFAKKALNHNKNVIMEKPITSNSKELKELIKIADERNLILIEAVTVHYLPLFKKIKDKISEIGKPRILTLNYSQYSSRYDDFKEGIIQPVFDYKKCGGALMDLNVYNINFLVGLFGKPKNIFYSANIERRIDTSGILIMDYGDFKSVCIGAKDCKAPIMSVLQGDEGSIRINTSVSVMNEYEFSDNKGNVENIKAEANEHRLYYEFVEFIKIIDGKDMKTAKKMLNISLTVSEIMEEARKQGGVVFGNEE